MLKTVVETARVQHGDRSLEHDLSASSWAESSRPWGLSKQAKGDREESGDLSAPGGADASRSPWAAAHRTAVMHAARSNVQHGRRRRAKRGLQTLDRGRSTPSPRTMGPSLEGATTPMRWRRDPWAAAHRTAVMHAARSNVQHGRRRRAKRGLQTWDRQGAVGRGGRGDEIPGLSPR